MAVLAEARKILYKLTDSDLELIKLLCLPDKIIGERLGISRAAVSMQLTRISAKLKVENRTAVVVKALGLDLVSIKQLDFRSFNGKTDPS